MNETLLLVLTWIPIVAESGLFIAIAKFIAKKLKDHFSVPEEMVKENKELRGEVAKLNKRISEEVESNRQMREKLENFSLQLKGIDPDYVKKRLTKN